MARSRKSNTIKRKTRNRKNKTRKDKSLQKKMYRFRYISENNVEGFT